MITEDDRALIVAHLNEAAKGYTREANKIKRRIARGEVFIPARSLSDLETLAAQAKELAGKIAK